LHATRCCRGPAEERDLIAFDGVVFVTAEVARLTLVVTGIIRMSVAFSMKRQQLDLGYAVWGNRAGTRPPDSGAAAGSRTSSSGLRKNAISVFSEEELIMRWLPQLAVITCSRQPFISAAQNLEMVTVSFAGFSASASRVSDRGRLPALARDRQQPARDTASIC
jgi:hypothetical protein